MRKYLRGKFIDSLCLHVKGGSGGMGYPKYGGLGGKGGDIYLVAKEGETLTTVLKTWPLKKIIANSGGNSKTNKLMGEPGEDKLVDVPIGVCIIDQQGRILGDLDNPGDMMLVARGGEGGSDDTQYQATAGQSHLVRLDLKLIADVGLVGFPNAGKSTILRALSRATPKVAAYPFTTVRPEIGMMQFRDLRQISIADLPGLLEGAHANFGMGHNFLRHVERTKLLLLVADATGFQLSPQHQHRSCLDTVLLLNKELELYKEDLLGKPALLIINKLDLPGASASFEDMKIKMKNYAETAENVPENLRPQRLLQFEDILGVSAQDPNRTADVLKYVIRQILDDSDMDPQVKATIAPPGT
ncbi:hypothetical protein B566_EDAN014862 [Ephemera danica]|nr:hypothetical protein B566_EDAN014862 [Ephemera danica]